MNLSHKDIAREHRISPGHVTCLQQKALKNNKFIAEMISERNAKEESRSKIRTAIEQMNHEDEFIDSVDRLRKMMAERHQIVAGDYIVRQVLRQDLKMSFRKVTPVSWTENSPKSKIIRQ